MINIYYAYGILWLIILVLNSLGWSNLCEDMNFNLKLFIVVMIVISFICGVINRNKLKFYKLEENPHKSKKTTFFLILMMIMDLFYNKNIPILYVLTGKAYNTTDFTGIPIIHNLIISFSIMYSTYLAYLYVCFRKKSFLLESLPIYIFFIILMQRQNILICIVLFLNVLVAEKLSEKKINKRYIFVIFIVFMIILYLFGVFGNIRYGSNWGWNDSSMISSLGKMNDKYPKILPKQYFWSYIYLVSPLANLNNTINTLTPTYNLGNLFLEFLPNFITEKLGYQHISPKLIVSSLTVCTSYASTYTVYGFFGMYFMYFIQIFITLLIIKCTYKNNKDLFIVVCNALFYFLVFSFFDNTFAYSITAYILLYSIFLTTGIKKIKFK